ncbi:hypothetical protein Poli38472_000705 [Pythium oligandrum]|uniref:Glycoside-hydrolase family GH114 TIM-barrel domain-containing protein n=1 Tax=Pythium oligandrum TaxID=41045 RepID=A0A8K1CCU4_PYTOL|nr:hypothetical protein Poli38472_000705 [Pythium oligandrum]|eukprot:TMW60663.1 hypothetical protein Poli38472_000705 [Pythium oligandrum]
MRAVAVLPFVLYAGAAHAWWKPTPGTSYQIQLQGDLDLSYNVSMYDIDLFDTPESTIDELRERGIKVICYFSAGTYETWRPDKDNFTTDMYGKELPDWENEFYVDTTNEAVRAVMKARIELAKEKGCDGVDPDNVDAMDNDSGLNLTETTQLDYNKFLAKTAHDLDLAVGLKNDLAQVEDLVDDFDFAINEECIEMGDCGDLKPFIASNKPVFGIEYNGDRKRGCALAKELRFDTLYKDLDLKEERYSCGDADLSSSSSLDASYVSDSSSGSTDISVVPTPSSVDRRRGPVSLVCAIAALVAAIRI